MIVHRVLIFYNCFVLARRYTLSILLYRIWLFLSILHAWLYTDFVKVCIFSCISFKKNSVFFEIFKETQKWPKISYKKWIFRIFLFLRAPLPRVSVRNSNFYNSSIIPHKIALNCNLSINDSDIKIKTADGKVSPIVGITETTLIEIYY